MKIVHSSRRPKVDLKGLSRDEAYALGMAAEKENDMDQAIAVYDSLVNSHTGYEPAYTRLMIIHRKLKDYKREIEIIDRAIEMSLSAYNKSSRLKINARITKLSGLLAKSTGLADKKGKPQFEPEKVLKLRARKAIAMKRMKKN